MQGENPSLTTLPNIGKNLSNKLNQVGISTVADFLNTGSEAAFTRIKAIDPAACINMLFALEGAVQGIRWHDLPASRKNELREFFNAIANRLLH